MMFLLSVLLACWGAAALVSEGVWRETSDPADEGLSSCAPGAAGWGLGVLSIPFEAAEGSS